MTEWKTRYSIYQMKKKLKGEDSSDNKEKGRYVEIYSQTKEGVFCEIGCRGLGHSLSMFEVRHRHWKRLEKSFQDAGYEIRRAKIIMGFGNLGFFR